MSWVRSLQHGNSIVLSPVRRVPEEIVMEILHHIRPAVDDPEETHVGKFNVFNVAEPVVSWASVQTMEGTSSVRSAPSYGQRRLSETE